MSFLPYAGGSAIGWVGALSGSALAHGAVIAGMLGVYGDLFVSENVENAQNANFVVSFERLDADTLIGITEQDGDDGSDGEDASAEPAEDDGEADQNTPDTEAAAEEPAPEEPDLTSLEPVTAIPVPSPELSPITPVETVAAVPVTGGAAAPETIAPTNLNTTPTPPAPPKPSSAPSAQDLAIGDLINRIRAANADECLVALPRRDGEDGIGLEIVASTDRAMEGFAQSVLTAEDIDLRQTRILIDPRQCPALKYVRQNKTYPATRMGLRIDATEIASGGNLSGILRGGAGRHITLLLIDDNGVVQDLQRFMSFSGNLAKFDIPVTRSGPARDTSQILLALGTTRAPVAIRNKDGELAQDVFSGLNGELADGALMAVATFDVR